MKITIDRQYTEDYQLPAVKEDIKAFKEMYTEGDLLRAFENQTGEDIYVEEIVRTKIEAFDSGWAFDHKTAFQVEMVVDAVMEMVKVRFYTDMELNVDTREIAEGVLMYDCRRFKEF